MGNRNGRMAAVLVALGLVVGGCGGGDSALTVTDAWSFRPPPGQQVSAAYGVVSNPTDSDIRIVAASSPVAESAELHETIIEDGSAMMQERQDGFVVPAGDVFVFEPGGPHIMLLGVGADSYPDEVEISLDLDDGSTVTFAAEVREVGEG